jgi:hypothetical protein
MSELHITVAVDLAKLQRFEKDIDNGLMSRVDNPIAKALKQWGVRYRSFIQERFDKYSKGGGDWPPLKPETIARRRGVKSKLKKFGKFVDRGKGKRRSFLSRNARIIDKDVRRVAGGKRGFRTRILRQKQKRLQAKLETGKGNRKNAIKQLQKIKQQLMKLQSKKIGNVNKGKNRLRRQGIAGKNAKILATVKVAILRDLGLLFAALSPTFSGKPGQLENRIPYGIEIGYGGSHRHGNGRATIADIASYHNVGSGRLPRRQIIVEPPSNVLVAMASDMERALDKMSRDAGDM